jgi:hypothetical protein
MSIILNNEYFSGKKGIQTNPGQQEQKGGAQDKADKKELEKKAGTTQERSNTGKTGAGGA